MRLSFVLEQCLAPVPGGTGRYSRELARALVATAPAGSAVTGWTAWHRRTRDARVPGAAGPRRLPLGRRPLVLAWEHGAPPWLPGDVVHAPTPLAPPRRRGQLLAVTVHDTVPWTHPETLTPRGVAWHRAAVGRALRGADLLVVPTSAVADDLVHVDPSCAARVLVVGEGVSDDLAVPADAAARARRLGLPADGYLLSLATLEPRKGLDVALRALASPAAPGLPLLVAGQPGWGGVDLPAAAAAAGLPPERLRLLGRVDDADLAVLLDRATALVAPSRAEGFGLPVLEAMALGTPVVSSDVPALVEVGGGATRTVPVGDPAALAEALAEVAGDSVAARALRQSMAAAGRDRAAAYSWRHAGAALWAAYGAGRT